MRTWTLAAIATLALSTPSGLLAHAGHEPVGASGLDALFHSVLGVDAGVALAVLAVVLGGWLTTRRHVPASR